MDAHYTKVMKAIEGIQDDATKLYFAYSGVLDQVAFNQWREEHSYHFFQLPQGRLARAENWDLVFDFPSRWWGGRVAGLTEKIGAHVYGLVFEIPAKNWPVVQHKEGVVTGMSVEKIVKVIVDGQSVEAMAFTTSPARVSHLGPISDRYVDALVRGARQSKLPEEYISSIPEKAK
jgi:cation transport regulator ChaC